MHDVARKSILAVSLIPVTVAPQLALAATPITIVVSASQDLNFGTITAGTAGGTVVINTLGARSVTGTVTAVTGAGLEGQGTFNVSGSTGLAMDATSFTISNGTDSMAVDNFNLLTNAGGTAGTITLVATSSTFPLGGTLNVGVGQANGTYTGTYTINVSYQ